jgi:hypothetical protein
VFRLWQPKKQLEELGLVRTTTTHLFWMRAIHQLNRLDDSGGSGDVFGLEFAHPNAVTEVSLSVRVQEAEVLGCTTNPSLSVIDAEFRGNFLSKVLPQVRSAMSWLSLP